MGSAATPPPHRRSGDTPPRCSDDTPPGAVKTPPPTLLAHSDTKLTEVLDGSKPGEVARLTVDDLVGLNDVGGGSGPSRVNTWHNVLATMQKMTKQLVAQREGKVSFEPLPSLVVTANGVSHG
ncbi:hypothetical protein Fmac_028342 [Flemingia macrophylla]|uniref:Uncharacterized protein n=1 Tax=Flemingia macrophylla TaxID=520843 RepID=A0ABD1L7L9_9FABA